MTTATTSITNQSSVVVGCSRKGCKGIEPGTAHQPSSGGFSCQVLPPVLIVDERTNDMPDEAGHQWMVLEEEQDLDPEAWSSALRDSVNAFYIRRPVYKTTTAFRGVPGSTRDIFRDLYEQRNPEPEQCGVKSEEWEPRCNEPAKYAIVMDGHVVDYICAKCDPNFRPALMRRGFTFRRL